MSRAIEKAKRGSGRFEITYRLLHISGHAHWVSERGHLAQLSAGGPLAIESVITDISGRKQAEELQRTLINRWRKTLDTIPQMVWSVSATGDEHFFNQQWSDFVGEPGQKAPPSRLQNLIHPDDRVSESAAWQMSAKSGAPYEAQYRLLHKSGSYRWVLGRALPELDSRGEVIRWYGTCTDIHAQVEAQRELVSNQKFVEKLIEATPDALALLDEQGRVLFANGVAKATQPHHSAAIEGRRWSEIVAPELRRAAHNAMAKARRAGKTAHFTISLPGPPERWWDVILTPVSDERVGSKRVLLTSRDITHQKEAEQHAEWTASHDPLTKLPNRLVLQSHAGRLLAENRPFAVVLVDLDDFKRTNDTMGHDAGDAVLCAVAERLGAMAGPSDVVARLGGDEFALVLSDVSSETDLTSAIDQVMAQLRPPFTHDHKPLECRASMGASLFPDHGRSVRTLLKHADLALYAAKTAGRGVLRTYHPALRSALERHRAMLAKGRRALQHNLITPFYQPKVNLSSGKVVGFEALLRLEGSRATGVPPALSACFKDLSLAADISERMARLVLADMRSWLDRGVAFGHVALNLSAADFRREDVAHRLLGMLENYCIPSDRLQIEVTETVFLGREASHAEQALRTLSDEGVRIALDDFGTGFASLSHLQRCPISVIKIDQSFIKNLQLDPNSNAIVDAVIRLGRSLNMDVVAEGIETKSQHDVLIELGCDTAQGFLYARPASAQTVPELLLKCLGPPPLCSYLAA